MFSGTRNYNLNEAAGLDRQAKLLSPLEACMTRSKLAQNEKSKICISFVTFVIDSDSGSNMSSGSPCLSPTLSNDGSGASSGDLYPQVSKYNHYLCSSNIFIL